MINNENLQKNVQDAIKWEPLLNAAEIGVIAKDGVITLSGIVDSYLKKTQAEEAARKVIGVKAVVEKIEVKISGSGNKNDTEIATEILNVFGWNDELPKETITVKVENGWVTLDGVLKWNSQREAAQRLLNNIVGVLGVNNQIKIKSELLDQIEKDEIVSAVGRNWAINNQEIKVSVSGNKVTLYGRVDSLYQKDEAGRIAWNAPGVLAVDNELIVN
jgi:osmotically-inducible protein OsmY